MHASHALAAVALLSMVSVACGSNGSSSGPADAAGDATNDTGSEMMVNGEGEAGASDAAQEAASPSPGDASPADGAIADGSPTDATSPADGSTPSDAGPDASCGANLQTDAHNCGGCGLDCGSGVCSVGHCVSVMTTATTGPYANGIAVGPSGVYVTTAADGRCIFSMPLTGGTPAALVSPAITPTVNGSDRVVLYGSTLYWVTGGGMGVYSVAAAGGAATPIATSEIDPGAIATDGTRLYWIDYSRIRYSPIASVSPTTLPVVTDAGSPFVNLTDIAVDGTYVYWSSRGTTQGTATVWRASKLDGTSVSQLVQSPADAIQGITIDANNVYFTSNYGGGNHGVYSIPLAGGAVTTLSSTEQFPTRIVSDAQAIYWLDGERVRKMTKSGGAASITTLASYNGAFATKVSGGGTFNDIAVDGSYVYFTQSGVPFTVYRVAKN